jgi:hypothetical protein
MAKAGVWRRKWRHLLLKKGEAKVEEKPRIAGGENRIA